MKALLLIIELSTDHVVEMLTVLPGLISQVVEHLFGSKVLTGNFLSVHQALAHGKKLVFTHLNHLSQLALFLVEACVLLLLLAQLGGGVKQKLEVLGVSTVLKQVNLGE